MVKKSGNQMPVDTVIYFIYESRIVWIVHFKAWMIHFPIIIIPAITGCV